MSSSQSSSTSSLSHQNKSMCIVPKEWKAYPKEAVSYVLCSRINEHWNNYKKVEGVVVKIGDVAAKLEYQNQRFWMRRYGDPRSKPHHSEYALTYLEHCKCPHKQVHKLSLMCLFLDFLLGFMMNDVQSLKLLDVKVYVKVVLYNFLIILFTRFSSVALTINY